jgi:hypothetical protein
MMESDADRLDAILALGGTPVEPRDRPEFWAIFERQYSSVSLGELDVESRSPALTCRSSDVDGMTKDEVLNVGGTEYRMLRSEPDTPALGWTVLVLRS